MGRCLPTLVLIALYVAVRIVLSHGSRIVMDFVPMTNAVTALRVTWTKHLVLVDQPRRS